MRHISLGSVLSVTGGVVTNAINRVASFTQTILASGTITLQFNCTNITGEVAATFYDGSPNSTYFTAIKISN